MWIGVETVLTRLFRRAHPDLGPPEGGLVDRRQLEGALAYRFECWYPIDIQHVGVCSHWRAFWRRWSATK